MGGEGLDEALIAFTKKEALPAARLTVLGAGCGRFVQDFLAPFCHRGAVSTDSELTSIPNVGPATARDLLRLGIVRPQDLRGRDPEDLFDRLCLLDGERHDPCTLDVFTAAVAFVEGGPARRWWEFSRERKARALEAAP